MFAEDGSKMPTGEEAEPIHVLSRYVRREVESLKLTGTFMLFPLGSLLPVFDSFLVFLLPQTRVSSFEELLNSLGTLDSQKILRGKTLHRRHHHLPIGRCIPTLYDITHNKTGL